MTHRGFITGKQGVGKSNTVSLIAETVLNHGLSLLIVDSANEYYSLKEEFEILRLGDLERDDLQINKEHGQRIAELCLKENILVIFDYKSYLEEEKADKVLSSILKHLSKIAERKRKPFPILIDEAKKFIPEKGKKTPAGKRILQIAQEDRKHGLGLILASQRPANTEKNYISQTDWKIWHKFSWETDFERVKNNLGKEYKQTIDDLSPGEAVLDCDPRFKDIEPTKVKILKKKTS